MSLEKTFRRVTSRNISRDIFLFVFIGALSAPVFLLAQTPGSLPTPVSDIKTKIATILTTGIVVIIGLAFVVFLWGIFKYVTAASLEGKAGAKETIIYGLIGLFIMLAAWGLVNILLGTFGFTSSNTGAPASDKIPKAFRP